MSFHLASGLVSLISLLLTLLVVYALLRGINYMNWKKRHDMEMGRKLDRLIELLERNNGKDAR